LRECGELSRIHSGDVGRIDDQEILTGEVEGRVLMRLEESEFADALCADATGGEVGDGSMREGIDGPAHVLFHAFRGIANRCALTLEK
jgi:hypothetical protein